MKKIILLLSFFIVFGLQAQVYSSKSQTQKPNFEPGVYTSSAKGQNIKLTINPDKTYDMSFFFGNYEVKNDTIYFGNPTPKSQKIVVKPIKDAPFSSTLKLKLNYDLSYYYSTEIYIGTQSDDNRKVTYKQVKDYFLESNIDLTQQNIEVEKSKYLYIVDAKYDNTTVFKFQIPETVNEAEIEYNPYSNSETKLNGYIDSISNQFVISDGKTPILFDFEKLDSANPKINLDLQAIEVKSDKNWLKDNGFGDVSGDEISPAIPAPYVFKHKRASSFTNALSDIKKTPNKFLVVVYDPENKKSKTQFEEFVTTNEVAVSDYMYSEYVESYDKFNFYFATDKDKKLLTKNNIISNQELIILNNTGDVMYHTNGSLTEKNTLFSIYNSIYDDLKKANDNCKLDQLISNKSSSVKDVKSEFRKILNSEVNYAVMPPPAPATDYPVTFTPPVVIKEIKEDVPVSEDPIKEKVEEVVEYVDTAATAYSAYDDYYDLIKDKENLYKLKASKQAILSKWKQVFDAFKNKKYDKEFVQIIKGELSNTGFSNKMYTRLNYDTTDLDFEMLDYVFANYKIISDPPTEPAAEASKQDIAIVEPAYEAYYYEQDIDTVLNTFFTNSNYGQNIQYEKVLKYYKKYLEISGFNASGIQNYMNALRLNIESGNNKKEYLTTYETYFNSIVRPNTSIIENLDIVFSKGKPTDYGDWTGYKNNFANLANDVSWYLVENSTDTSYLKKAVQWSETSLIIEKNNHYYLDTLAQLYYKNGDKQKAILTEQKAIDANTDEENLKEYKATLNKMKSGTY